MAGARSHFANPASQASSHYGVSLTGEADQYVDLGDRAWANGILEAGHRWRDIYSGTWDGWTENPNNWTVSIETEDRNSGETPVSDEQYGTTLALCRRAMARYPSISFLTSHHVISPQSRPFCCGPRWIASGRMAALARELELVLVV